MTTPMITQGAAGADVVDPSGGRPVAPARGRLRPLGLREITNLRGFWGQRQQVNTTASLSHCEHWMERVGWLTNFDRVTSGTTGPDRPGWSFSDSEIYKLLEALCWEAGRTGSPDAEAAITRLTARIAPAQDEDGYLNTCFGHSGQPARYTDLEMGHELYCTGHLLQAAAARMRTTGADTLVEIARRAADHVCSTFGASGLQKICGHPEIEVGLAEFGRAMRDDRYIEQARIFLDRRGHATLEDIPFGRAYFQDDVPIRDADVWRGHAVRALYLSAAAVDVAVDRQDDELLHAIERQWERTVARRTYITGGMGSRHQDEGFGEDWELPPDRAYCETCAGVASIMVSWRLYLATGDVRYADLIERTLFNVVAASPSADGRAFFYANPQHQRFTAGHSDHTQVSPRAEGGTRAAWFDVSCCPTNVARTLASIDSYLATADTDGVQVHLYVTSNIRTSLPDGRDIAIDIETDYPTSGTISLRTTGNEPRPWTLTLRVPAWASGAVLTTPDGQSRDVQPGLVTINRAFAAGDEVILQLPMQPRFTWPDPRIDAIRSCVAVERGPEVLCVEGIDLPAAAALDGLRIDPSAPPQERDGAVYVTGRLLDLTDTHWPFLDGPPTPGPDGRTSAGEIQVVLHPYHQWAERAPTTMRVWLPLIPTTQTATPAVS